MPTALELCAKTRSAALHLLHNQHCMGSTSIPHGLMCASEPQYQVTWLSNPAGNVNNHRTSGNVLQ
jgi:hypothetical protein